MIPSDFKNPASIIRTATKWIHITRIIPKSRRQNVRIWKAAPLIKPAELGRRLSLLMAGWLRLPIYKVVLKFADKVMKFPQVWSSAYPFLVSDVLMWSSARSLQSDEMYVAREVFLCIVGTWFTALYMWITGFHERFFFSMRRVFIFTGTIFLS